MEFANLRAGDKLQLLPASLIKYKNGINSENMKYFGTVVTFERYLYNEREWFDIKEDNGRWAWHFDEIDYVVDECEDCHDYDVGDPIDMLLEMDISQ